MSAKLRVLSPDQAEDADVVVCLRTGDWSPRYFGDGVETVCSECQHAIVHPPHAPKKPPKICLECLLDRVKGGHA